MQRLKEVCPKKSQNLLFSATMPKWVIQLTQNFMSSNSYKINMIGSNEMKTSTTVKHLSAAV